MTEQEIEERVARALTMAASREGKLRRVVSMLPYARAAIAEYRRIMEEGK
jgi:hypothetical protein